MQTIFQRFSKDDVVEAKWEDDNGEQWLDATVIGQRKTGKWRFIKVVPSNLGRGWEFKKGTVINGWVMCLAAK